MSYLLFNKKIIYSDGVNAVPITTDDLPSVKEAKICIVDADVLIASSVEQPIQKRDSVLVRKFNESYTDGPYVIQEEKIDTNLFQVIGIKEQKLRGIYSLIPFDKVRGLLSYGAAVRGFLRERKINLDEPFVFVDDQGDERLLTAFEGLKFSRTRVIANTDDDILPEIRRTQIDFSKKIEGYSNKKSSNFVVLVNSKALAEEISAQGHELRVDYIDIPYPAFEGLEKIDHCVSYELPEEILKRKRQVNIKNNLKVMSLAIGSIVLSLVVFFVNRVEWGIVNKNYHTAEANNQRLKEELEILEKETYRESIRQQKTLHYALLYLSILNTIPSSYVVTSFRLVKTDRWRTEMRLFTGVGSLIEEIPRIKLLKTAVVKDVFVNNQPGKYIRVTL